MVSGSVLAYCGGGDVWRDHSPLMLFHGNGFLPEASSVEVVCQGKWWDGGDMARKGLFVRLTGGSDCLSRWGYVLVIGEWMEGLVGQFDVSGPFTLILYGYDLDSHHTNFLCLTMLDLVDRSNSHAVTDGHAAAVMGGIRSCMGIFNAHGSSTSTQQGWTTITSSLAKSRL